jgi:hypothetical protein
MGNQASKHYLFSGGLGCIGKIVGKIINYLASNDLEILNDRNLLRELHRAGYMDEIKTQNYSGSSSKLECDPEELQMPM